MDIQNRFSEFKSAPAIGLKKAIIFCLPLLLFSVLINCIYDPLTPPPETKVSIYREPATSERPPLYGPETYDKDLSPIDYYPPNPQTSTEESSSPIQLYTVAIIFASSILLFSAIITSISFTVSLFSKDKNRRKTAGGIFKTSFGFLLTSGTSVMTFLGFKIL